MNRSMLAGVIGGVAIATGVGSYALLGPDTTDPEQQAAVALEAPAASAEVAVAERAPVEQECWDEEVEVTAEARDEKAIAGTAAGAVIGGALAKELGDDNKLLTAAGAAAGAYAGRRAQREFQENNTTTTTERRCAPAGTR